MDETDPESFDDETTTNRTIVKKKKTCSNNKNEVLSRSILFRNRIDRRNNLWTTRMDPPLSI